ncbi:MAG TPA: acyl-CoA reductase [Chryseolinea sp.]|nr:acyl-CoA reductase [Chryseolinea sp.]
MIIEERIKAFVQLGEFIKSLPDEKFKTLAESIRIENPWFTEENLRMTVSGILQFLDEKNLREWLSGYSLSGRQSKVIAIIMAGNIPAVGFHDLLCVLIKGDSALIKLSSKDTTLMKFLIGNLIDINPSFASKMSYAEQLRNFDAVIATGSDNTSRYFEYYFGKYPHIIRKNRTSIAILDGTESEKELTRLGTDVFSYFGLGCRNVSKLFVPSGFNFNPLFESWEVFHDIEYHHKYYNNYQYQKTIFLLSQIPFLDNGFVLLHESEKLVSPIAIVYYEYYNAPHELEGRLAEVRDKIQCIVGHPSPATLRFGDAQYPALHDYADGVDVLKFLNELS